MAIQIKTGQFPVPSDKALGAFRSNMPKLIVFANDKFFLEKKFVAEAASCTKNDLIQSFNKNISMLLMGVYEFGLFENLPEELIWHIAFLESRGVKKEFIEEVFKSWIMAIQCLVKYPESEELVPPLQWTVKNLSDLYGAVVTTTPEPDDTTGAFIDYILKKNRKFAAECLLGRMREGTTLEQVYTDTLLPALSHIRFLWRQNSISVADEHVATDICRYVMFRVIDSIFGERRYPFKVLAACMPGERDTLSAEVFANYLEINGWSVYFIGQTASSEEIIHAIQKNRPHVVVVSVGSVESLPEAKTLLQLIRRSSHKTALAIEGRAALLARTQLESQADVVLSGLEEGHTAMLNLVMPDA